MQICKNNNITHHYPSLNNYIDPIDTKINHLIPWNSGSMYSCIDDVKNQLEKIIETHTYEEGVLQELLEFLFENRITKEELESTRIGRLVNIVRKQCNSERISKQAKKIIKKWQTLIKSQTSTLTYTNSVKKQNIDFEPNTVDKDSNVEKNGFDIESIKPNNDLNDKTNFDTKISEDKNDAFNESKKDVIFQKNLFKTDNDQLGSMASRKIKPIREILTIERRHNTDSDENISNFMLPIDGINGFILPEQGFKYWNDQADVQNIDLIILPYVFLE